MTGAIRDPAYHEPFAELVLRCLEVPTQADGSPWSYCAFVDRYDLYQCPHKLADLYPDDLMRTAAHCLPHVCKPGDMRVVKVIMKWMQRSTFSRWTLDEILRVAPCMLAGIDRSTRRDLLRGQLETCLGLLRSWHHQGGMAMARSDAARMLDWEISARYWAI